MAQNPLVEQAKQGNVNAIASLMNRLLKSQGMLANVEREGDRLDVLIESDLRSLDDEVRIPKRQVLVGMIKKWFVTLEVQTVNSISISWQQTGFDTPAWTEEIYLVEQEKQNISQNGGITEPVKRPRIPPLPVFPTKSMRNDERNNLSRDRSNSGNNSPSGSSPDLDEMFGENSTPVSLPNIPTATNLNIEQDKSSQDSDFLFLSDVPYDPEVEEFSDSQNRFQDESQNVSKAERPASLSGFSLMSLLQTPSFTIQFVQYCVVCAILILAFRGMHAVFGSSKAPKAATTISTQIVLL